MNKILYDKLVVECCARFKIKIDDLFINRRFRKYVEAREIFYFICNRLLGETCIGYSQLARISGRKSHCTTLHAVNSFEARLRNGDNKAIRNLYEVVTRIDDEKIEDRLIALLKGFDEKRKIIKFR